jgi:hypothetical protein
MQYQQDGTIGGDDTLGLHKAATVLSNDGTQSNDINNQSLLKMDTPKEGDQGFELNVSRIDAPNEMIKWDDDSTWKKFIRIIQESKKVKRALKREKMSLALCFKNFEALIDTDKLLIKIPELNENMLKGALLSESDLIRNLVEYIQDQIFEPSARQNVRDLLRIFCVMINESENLNQIQNLLNRNQAMTMVLSILSEESRLDDSMVRDLLSLAIALIRDQNETVQKSVYSFFMNFKQSEHLFARFRERLILFLRHIESGDHTENDGFMKKIEICEQILSFIQMMCEGHYTELQDYIRYQSNSRKSYNLLEPIVDLILCQFENVDRDNVKS